MKNITLLFLTGLAFSQVVTGQTDQSVQQPKKFNSVSVEFYQPINDLSRDYIYVHNQLVFADWSKINYKSRSAANAVGLSYERLIKNDVVIRTRVGMSFTEIKESNNTGPMVVTETLDGDESFEYRYFDKSLNVFVGAAKKVNLTKKISLSFGADFASIFNMGGEGQLIQSTNLVDVATGDNYYLLVTNKTVVGNSNVIALAPFIKPEMLLFDNIFVALEFQVFYSRIISSDQTHNFQTTERKYIGSQDVEIEQTERTINYDVKQWNWSNISPLIRIGYKF